MTIKPQFRNRLVLALVLWGAASGAYAAANGDGLCSSSETGNFECATFGASVIEFLGAFPSTQCRLSSGQTTSCTSYYYRYSGATTNQLNVAIPTRNTKTFKTAADINCSQFLTGGAGDPTTGFGKNQLSLGICRIAQNLAAGPLNVTPPAGANFVITVDPSAYDTKNPLDWQLRRPPARDCSEAEDRRRHGATLFAASLLGPFSTQPEVVEAAVTLTTPTGESVSYSNLGGNIQITGGSARVIPLGGTKLCTLNVGGDASVPYTASNFAANWTCETVTYATEQCDIKTAGGDPCRMIGGTCIKY